MVILHELPKVSGGKPARQELSNLASTAPCLSAVRSFFVLSALAKSGIVCGTVLPGVPMLVPYAVRIFIWHRQQSERHDNLSASAPRIHLVSTAASVELERVGSQTGNQLKLHAHSRHNPAGYP